MPRLNAERMQQQPPDLAGGKPAAQRIVLSTICRHTGDACKAGYMLIERMNEAMASASKGLPEDFELNGTACLETCLRRCTVMFCARRDGSYVFGDVPADSDVSLLIACAESRITAEATGEWNAALGVQPPVPAEAPAAMIAAKLSGVRLQ